MRNTFLLFLIFALCSCKNIGLGQVILRNANGTIDTCTSTQIFGYSSGCSVSVPISGIYYIDIRVGSTMGGTYSYNLQYVHVNHFMADTRGLLGIVSLIMLNILFMINSKKQKHLERK
ncbi:hypothetical protein AGMMS50262_02490 [Bacteroidia bacterium]|nr:hypothetical protein AGMMS50262_02490 [Bacteroidia bacterium]